ncbi:MAG: zinc-dependent metalloprotease [Sciscionella sp.]
MGQAQTGASGSAENRPTVDLSTAANTGAFLARGGPPVSQGEAEVAVEELRAATMAAEGHVREITRLGAELPLLPGDIVDRPGWVRAAADGLGALTEDVLRRPVSGLLGGVLAGGAGVQAGMVLAFLASRVLGQYDPFGTGGGRLLIVAPNVISAQRVMRVPADDFRLWVCLHESTHRLQFTAVPWLRDHFAAEVGNLLSAMDDSATDLAGRLPELMRAARERLTSREQLGGGLGLIELLQAPEQRKALRRLLALSTLLEGHADHVMDAVGPSVVPSVVTIRSRFTERRKGGGLLDRLLRVVLGVDAKVRQYAEGAAFTTAVVDAVGMDGFNAVWTSPETLPSRREITEPRAWLHRVHG